MPRAIDENTTRSFSLADLNTDFDDDPRIQDIALGSALGFARPRKIRETIERNNAELEAYGSLALRRGKSRGQSFSEYHLNEPQALLICMWSNTAKAAAVRKMLIDVFMEYRRGKLEKPIHVRQHDRRTSTKVDEAIRLKKNIDRLEGIANRMQSQMPNFCAMFVDGEHVFVDTNKFGGVGRAVVIDAEDRMRLEYIDTSDARGRSRSVFGPWYSKGRGKARDAVTIVGMVMEPAARGAPVIDMVKSEISQMLEAGPFTDEQIAKRLICAPSMVKAVRSEHNMRIR